MTHVGFRYTYEWHSPYTTPPNGLPRIKAEMFETLEARNERVANGETSVPESFSALNVIGDGYNICIQSICTPAKQLTKETLASVRMKRLRRKAEKKFPLIAEQVIADEYQKNKSYFDGTTREDLQAGHDMAINEEIDLYQRFLKATTA